MRFVVTGGCGFIGSNIVASLAMQGHDVTALDVGIDKKRQLLDSLLVGATKKLKADGIGKISIVEADIRDQKELLRAFHGADFVLHHAAKISVAESVVSPADYVDINITGTLNVLEAARICKIKRVVFASSSAVYGDSENFPLQESELPMPVSPYAITKLCGEQFCSMYSKVHGLETVSLRYFNVYGPGQNPKAKYASAIPIFIKLLRDNERPIIYGDGEQTRDFVFVQSIVEANMAACLADAKLVCGKAFNIASARVTTINELLGMLEKLLGKNILPIHMPARPGDPKHSRADTSLARKLLGFSARVGIEEGLKRTIEWQA